MNNNNNNNENENFIILNELNFNPIKMPMLGIGTFKLNDIENIIKVGLENGYRRIDTASMYNNEERIGKVLNEMITKDDGLDGKKIKREDLFITSKCSFMEQGYENALKAFESSLKKLQLDYLDCYLIHWPGVKGLDGSDSGNSIQRAQTWRALEKLYQDKKVRSIGVSNYTINHLTELLSSPNLQIKPAINQVEFHPLNFQKDLLEFCKNNKIVLESYGSLASGKLLNNESVKEFAKKVGRTPSQLLLRYCLEHNCPVIPKTENVHRLIENQMILDFTLPDDIVNSLDKLNKDQRFYMNPNSVI
ncbi:hypothetical protein ACTFIW_002217 [Dictyostelium discoideum]